MWKFIVDPMLARKGIDEEIKSGMDIAEKEVIKTLELLGMVPT